MLWACQASISSFAEAAREELKKRAAPAVLEGSLNSKWKDEALSTCSRDDVGPRNSDPAAPTSKPHQCAHAGRRVLTQHSDELGSSGANFFKCAQCFREIAFQRSQKMRSDKHPNVDPGAVCTEMFFVAAVQPCAGFIRKSRPRLQAMLAH
eukprot:s1066_g15.t1